MKRCVYLFLFLFVCAPVRAERARSFSATVEADLDGDGSIERITLDAGRERTLRLWHGRQLLWQGVTSRWQPWKLMVADVDGDGRREIALGIFKSTHFIPQPHNCLFLYSWDGRALRPKWLGSTLSKPFMDFTFTDFNRDGQNELLAIEIKRDGKRCVAAYSWNSFGFTLDWQRGAWASARLSANRSGEVVVEADGERIIIKPDLTRNEL